MYSLDKIQRRQTGASVANASTPERRDKVEYNAWLAYSKIVTPQPPQRPASVYPVERGY